MRMVGYLNSEASNLLNSEAPDSYRDKLLNDSPIKQLNDI